MLAITTAGLLTAMGSCPDGSEPAVQPYEDNARLFMSTCNTLFPVPNQPQTREDLCRASTASTPCCGGTYRVLTDGIAQIAQGSVHKPIYCLGGVLPAKDDLHQDLWGDGARAVMGSCGRGLQHIEFKVETLENDDDPLSVTETTLLMSTVDCRHGLVSAGAVGGIVAGSVLGPFAVATVARALL